MLRPQSQHFVKLEEHHKYLVESSDVIEDLRIYVKDEGSERVFWYKERFLTEDEIVENVVENATSKICWTIHRPKRGWYIRVRAPTFPPGVSIPLAPLPASSPFHAEAALSFCTRTNSSKRSKRLSPTIPPHVGVASTSAHSNKSSVETATTSSETVIHSYPPTPSPGASAARIQPPSPDSVRAKLDQLSSSRSQATTSSPDVRTILLAPHSSPHVPASEDSSLITRTLSMFKNSKPSHSLSFTLCPLPADGGPSAIPLSQQAQATNDTQSKRHSIVRLSELLPPSPLPLLTFHDRTPTWSFGSTKGLLEIDTAMEKDLGVDRSFWVSVALAYMEFLTERESYLAAAGG